jgi:hypothetical protein
MIKPTIIKAGQGDSQNITPSCSVHTLLHKSLESLTLIVTNLRGLSVCGLVRTVNLQKDFRTL